jgi:chromosome segregation ATPase
MKRSRLRMFKATSMTISVMGVLMIVATIVILGYLGFQSLSSFISADASNNNANTELASLKSEYSSLKTQYENVKTKVVATNNKILIAKYDNAEIELVKTQSAIGDVESAMTVGKSSDEINNRIQTAKYQLQQAKTSLSTFRSSSGY